MYRIGLVGAGGISSAHADAWHAARDRAKVVAVADIDAPAATRLAARFGARVFADYQDLLDAGSVDAIDICLPPSLHHRVVTSAAERSVHVLCEKPIARTLEEADEIAAVIEAAGITYLPAHNTIFYPTVRRARQYVGRGDLGPIFTVRSWDCDADVHPDVYPTRFAPAPPRPVHRPGESWRSSPSLLGGGALIDGGFHGVYRLLYLWPQPVREVMAMIGRFHPDLGGSSEDTAILIVRFEGGALGEILISYAFDAPTTGRDRLFTMVGREGALSGDEATLELRIGKWDEPSQQALSRISGEVAWRDTFRLEVSHFLDVLDGVADPIQTLSDARRALEVIRAAYQSVESGTIVALPLVAHRP